MLIVCPNCKNRFDIDPSTVREARKMRCSSCRAVFRLVRKTQPEPQAPPEAPAPAREPVSPAAEPAPLQEAPAPVQPAAQPASPPGRLKVVIANESAPFCEAVQKVLCAEPFDVTVCNDGKVALETVQRLKPRVLLLDVALPTMFGFEVCERVRQDPELAGVKIVLIASIYDKTRYKRSPNSLYGADDYIEKHHIPDSLVPMIYRLASTGVTVAASPTEQELAAQQESREEIRQVEVAETCAAAAPAADAGQAEAAAEGAEPPAKEAPPGAPPVQLSGAEVKARRLARIIVSDIVLYNQGKVEQGLREGNFYELLADDIREGENLYQQRVSREVRETSSFLKEAFEELIAKKRAELRI